MTHGTRPNGGPTLADVGEFGLIDQVVGAGVQTAAVETGPGDDAAVLRTRGSIVVSTDALVEGVHFRTDWSSAHDVGRKAVAENVADLEAMGATPVALVVAFSAPAETPVAWARELMDGIRAECELAGVALVGGDTTGGQHIAVTGTAIGELAGRAPVLRSGARPEQVVAMVGRTGWAAAGLAVLRRGFRSPRAAVEAQRCPQVPYGQGRVAAEAGAASLIDVSDGLLADLGHIARASGVVIDLDSARFEIPDVLAAVGQATGADPLGFVLTGGEDHALVGTFDFGDVPEHWSVVGRVLPGDAPAVLVDGAPWDGTQGWDHF